MACKSAPPKILIFDWDDTICPSSFFDRWQIENVQELPVHFQHLFSELAKCAEKCLAEASKYGEVIIITNSDEGWVKFSAERFVPDLVPVVERYQIVSARTAYEKYYPGQPLCWKAAAFAHEVNEIYEAKNSSTDASTTSESSDADVPVPVSDESDIDESLEWTDASSIGSSLSADDDDDSKRTSKRRRRSIVTVQMDAKSGSSPKRYQRRREIISFGDSMEERTAVQIVSNQFSAIPKSVMFMSSPNPIQIIGQLQMITTHMNYLCVKDAVLDLEISQTQAERFALKFMKRNKCEHFANMVLMGGPQPTTLADAAVSDAAFPHHINEANALESLQC